MRVKRVWFVDSHFGGVASLPLQTPNLRRRRTSLKGPHSESNRSPALRRKVLAQNRGSVKISIDDAIQMALQHQPQSSLAARTTIQQNEWCRKKLRRTLRPNPVILGDTQFLPLSAEINSAETTLDNAAQFDIGLSYLFERGKKRQHRLQAAKDQTAVTRSQVADNERSLTLSVAQQFINVELAESALDLAQEDLKSFQNSVDISEARYKAGDISEDDLLKTKLQMLQFQTDVSQAMLARVQRAVRPETATGIRIGASGLRCGRIV